MKGEGAGNSGKIMAAMSYFTKGRDGFDRSKRKIPSPLHWEIKRKWNFLSVVTSICFTFHPKQRKDFQINANF